MREKVMEILSGIRPDIDFDVEDKLVSDGLLASLDVVVIVDALSDEYGINIKPKDLLAENFNSVEAIIALIERLLK